MGHMLEELEKKRELSRGCWMVSFAHALQFRPMGQPYDSLRRVGVDLAGQVIVDG